MTVNSPYSGKPMRVVYEPDIWEMRGEQFPYVHIAFRDDENDEQFTTTESDMICFDQVANQYREKHASRAGIYVKVNHFSSRNALILRLGYYTP